MAPTAPAPTSSVDAAVGAVPLAVPAAVDAASAAVPPSTPLAVDALLHALVDLGTPFTPPVTGTLSDSDLLDRQRMLTEV